MHVPCSIFLHLQRTLHLRRPLSQSSQCIMPRENRKRGKKHKKVLETNQDDVTALSQEEETQTAGPSWIVPNPNSLEEGNVEAPFGLVDSDVKAYFRTVDVQIREWQENAKEENDEVDPNEGI
jgi:nucleolar protein 9